MHNSGQECQSGDVRLDFEETYTSEQSVEFIHGILNICVNGNFYKVCLNESLVEFNFTEIANLACQQLGYPGMCACVCEW